MPTILKVRKTKTTAPAQEPTEIASAPKKPDQPKKEKPPTDSSEKPALFYQGVGWLHGLISKTENGWLQITLRDGTSFPFTARQDKLKVLYNHLAEEPDKPIWLHCFPKITDMVQTRVTKKNDIGDSNNKT